MTNVLKVFGSGSWHEDVFLVGDKESLEKLRDAIEKALASDKLEADLFFETDGEGYNLFVKMENDEATLDESPFHYTDDMAIGCSSEEHNRRYLAMWDRYGYKEKTEEMRSNSSRP